MDTLAIEVFSFRELDAEGQAEATYRIRREYECLPEDVMYWVDANRHRFFGNGLIFDALGIEADGETPSNG